MNALPPTPQNNIAAWIAYEVFFFIHKTCTQGASTTIYAAVKPELKNLSGAYLIHDSPRLTAGCSDDVAELLWRESAEMVKLSKAELDALN